MHNDGLCVAFSLRQLSCRPSVVFLCELSSAGVSAAPACPLSQWPALPERLLLGCVQCCSSFFFF